MARWFETWLKQDTNYDPTDSGPLVNILEPLTEEETERLRQCTDIIKPVDDSSVETET